MGLQCILLVEQKHNKLHTLPDYEATSPTLSTVCHLQQELSANSALIEAKLECAA